MNVEKNNQEIIVNSVESIFNSFNRNIYGSELFFLKFSDLAVSEDKEEVNRTKEYIDECFKEIGLDPNSKSEESKKKFSKEEVERLLNKLNKVPRITQKNYEILANSSFLMLNNYFEYLMADLLSYYYNKFDGTISSNEMVTTLNHVNEFESIEEFKKDLIHREVESMLIEKTFSELLDHFEKFLEVELCKDILDWKTIEEFRERRHLIVHNSAKVNKKYITRTKNPFKLKKGDSVNITPEYFKSALHEYKLAGYLLILSCWGKWDKDKASEAIETLLVESFEALKNDEPKFALRLTMYLKYIQPKTDEQEDLILRILFNKCIALKILDKQTELSKELKKIKIGTASPIFKLAHAVLSGSNLESILDLIKQTHALEQIDLEKYSDWPIYSSLRSDPKKNEEVTKLLKVLEKKVIPTATETTISKRNPTKNKSVSIKKKTSSKQS